MDEDDEQGAIPETPDDDSDNSGDSSTDGATGGLPDDSDSDNDTSEEGDDPSQTQDPQAQQGQQDPARAFLMQLMAAAMQKYIQGDGQSSPAQGQQAPMQPQTQGAEVKSFDEGGVIPDDSDDNGLETTPNDQGDTQATTLVYPGSAASAPSPAAPQGAIPAGDNGLETTPDDQGDAQGSAPNAQSAGSGLNKYLPGMSGENAGSKPVAQNAKKMWDYLMGAGAMPAHVDQAIEHSVDPNKALPGGQRQLQAIKYAGDKGGVDAAIAMLQADRQQYDAAKSFSAAALKSGNVASAIDAANKAAMAVPDSGGVHFTASPQGVTATITDANGTARGFPLSMDQFQDFVGQGGQFDKVIQQGVGGVIQSLGAMSGTGVGAQGMGPGPDVNSTPAAPSPNAAQDTGTPAPSPNSAVGGSPMPNAVAGSTNGRQSRQPNAAIGNVNPSGEAEEYKALGVTPEIERMSRQRFPWVSQESQRLDYMMQLANQNKSGEDARNSSDRTNKSKELINDRTNKSKENIAEINQKGRNTSAGIRAGALTQQSQDHLIGTLQSLAAKSKDNRVRAQAQTAGNLIGQLIKAAPMGVDIGDIEKKLNENGIDLKSLIGGGGSAASEPQGSPGSGGGNQANNPQGNGQGVPQVGFVKAYGGVRYQFKGGDPNKRANWSAQ